MSSPERASDGTEVAVWSNERISYVVDLLVHQDTLTWTITSVSLAAQTVLLGFYFQIGASGRLVVAVMGAVSSFVLLVFTIRSDTYMNHYMHLLKVTGLVEFRPLPRDLVRIERRREKWRDAPEGVRKWFWNKMLQLPSINSAGTWLVGMDEAWFVLWLLLLMQPALLLGALG